MALWGSNPRQRPCFSALEPVSNCGHLTPLLGLNLGTHLRVHNQLAHNSFHAQNSTSGHPTCPRDSLGPNPSRCPGIHWTSAQVTSYRHHTVPSQPARQTPLSLFFGGSPCSQGLFKKAELPLSAITPAQDREHHSYLEKGPAP